LTAKNNVKPKLNRGSQRTRPSDAACSQQIVIIAKSPAPQAKPICTENNKEAPVEDGEESRKGKSNFYPGGQAKEKTMRGGRLSSYFFILMISILISRLPFLRSKVTFFRVRWQ
jgi:hypothetical protein